MKDYLRTAILVVALLVVGYFLLPYVKIHPKSPATQTPNPSDSQSAAKTFSSDILGISFKYMPDQDGDGKADTDVKETGDKVYVYYTATPAEQGQWVQEFSKDPTATLIDAVKKQFLANISEKDCFAVDLDQFYQQYGASVPPAEPNFVRAIIAFPFPADQTQPFDTNATKCPATYRLSNGLSYFAMDKNHPDKYFFFSIGQYGIMADTGGQKTWQDTFTVTK